MIIPKKIDKVQWRKWRNLDWRHPQLDLFALGLLQSDLEKQGISPTTDDLRQRELRPFLERKQAALFSYFISHSVLHLPVQYAMYEDEDYDCILIWKVNEQKRCAFVQLKEVVPPHINPVTTIEGELAKLAKYVKSDHTVVAVHINQSGMVDYSAIKKPETSVGEIWLYSSISPDQSLWFLYGDLLNIPRWYEIPWPTSITKHLYSSI